MFLIIYYSKSIPTKYFIITFTLSIENSFQLFANELIIRFFIKKYFSDIFKNGDKLFRNSLTQYFGLRCEFLLQYFLIFFLLIPGIHILPRQMANKEVNEYINKPLNIVSSSLLYS